MAALDEAEADARAGRVSTPDEILLHAGGVDWPARRPPAPRIRTRSPQSDT